MKKASCFGGFFIAFFRCLTFGWFSAMLAERGIKMTKKIKMAICYDFDGTLSPKNMQEVTFIPKLKMSAKMFWTKAKKYAKKHKMDPILAYMKMMIKEADYEQISITRKDFKHHGKQIPLFDGVDTWFKRINQYAASKGIEMHHYIISSGLEEMIKGSPIAKHFSGVFASSFQYDASGKAEWPAVAMNYTTKTQYLFRLNKGCLDITDNKCINEFVPHDKRVLPFEQMIYIGDGETDVPCMSLLKKMGGHSIAVYKKRSSNSKQTAEKMKQDGRVHACFVADYREDKPLDQFIKKIIDDIAAAK